MILPLLRAGSVPAACALAGSLLPLSSNTQFFCRDKEDLGRFGTGARIPILGWVYFLVPGTPLPSISGIINLAANCEIIYGLQSLTGKILSHKGLSTSCRFLLATLAVPSWDKWQIPHKVRCHNVLWKSSYPFEPSGNTAIKKCVCAAWENSGLQNATAYSERSMRAEC